MSWGTKITVLYIGFVCIILTLVFICFGHKTELEYKDYYARELKFQDQIDAINNANALVQGIDYEIKNRTVKIILPEKLMSGDFNGSALFLRPSDASSDLTLKLTPDTSGTQLIDEGFLKGVYKMQLSINSLGKSYFKEAIINFN
jgi:hypothetical protein